MRDLEAALHRGLAVLPYAELVQKAAAHMARPMPPRQPRVISPSLLAMECRLARAKTYFGHPPQPGAPPADHERAGMPDAGTNLVMARGAFMEGIVVTALEAAGVRIRHRSPDPITASEDGWAFETHPDLIIETGAGDRTVQIKCPSANALDYFRAGEQDVILARYGTQVLGELLIAEMAGWEVLAGGTLLLVSAEPWPPTTKGSPLRVIEVEFAWEDQQRGAILGVVHDFQREIEAVTLYDRWPAVQPLDIAGKFPCAYCRFPRVATLMRPHACDSHWAWDRPRLSAVAAPAPTFQLRVLP